MSLPLLGQHPEHHKHGNEDTAKQEEMKHPRHPAKEENMSHEAKEQDMHARHTSAFSLSLPMQRDGSGTGWQPDATPVFGYMKNSGKWRLMYHGNLFLRYTSQNINHDGRRGKDSQLDAPNWVMGMFQRPIGENGLFSSSVMISLDRLVMGGDGYPLLFQTGESWQGEPLIDRQHPHELFSGLSIGYSHRITDKVDLYGYLGYPGEPAIGPVAFMHRASALSNPDAPLGHHWQDATHIVFGVATLGIRYSIVKLEGSVFTGREPDENRYDFDEPRFDSYSYRLSMNPLQSVTFQFSQAFLESPEILHPGEDVTRTTASIQHSTTLNMQRYLLSSFVYGLNSGDEIDEHSFLIESNLILPRAHVYGRFEQLQKSAEELAIPLEEEVIFDISAFTVGAAYKLLTFSKTDLFAGIQGTLNATDNTLKDLYGTSPLSGELYLRFSPSLMHSGADHQ